MTTAPAGRATVYECDDCGFTYNAEDFGGVDLSEQEDDFVCPNCQATKSHFHPQEPPPDDLQAEVEPDLEAPAEEAPGSSKQGAAASHGAVLDTRRVYTEAGDQSVASLKELYDDNDLDPQPDFQRYVVWTSTQQSKLIESALLDLPIPRIYLAEDKDERQVVVDGQQRLIALFDFMDSKYALTNLKVRTDLNSKTHRDLDKTLRKRIKNFKLSTVLIQKESDENLRFDLYERLNTGAVGLNDQELRRSVYRGDYNDFIYRLADLPDWRKLLKLKDRHKRMADAELVLRFMAFRDQTYNNFPDNKSLKDFLNNQMELGKVSSKPKLKAAEKDFKQAVSLTLSVFGDKAFRKFSAGEEDNPEGGWESRRVLALADVQLWGFTKFKKVDVMAHADAIREAAIELMSDLQFTDVVTNNTSDPARVEKRFRMWKDMLDSVLAGKSSGPRAFDRKKKEELFNTDATCAICKQAITLIDDAHVDHVKPRAKGGPTKDDNAALTHRFCNLSKGAKTGAKSKAS
jgi:rubredoxin